jgi:hypothetical protein
MRLDRHTNPHEGGYQRRNIKGISSISGVG